MATWLDQPHIRSPPPTGWAKVRASRSETRLSCNIAGADVDGRRDVSPPRLAYFVGKKFQEFGRCPRDKQLDYEKMTEDALCRLQHCKDADERLSALEQLESVFRLVRAEHDHYHVPTKVITRMLYSAKNVYLKLLESDDAHLVQRVVDQIMFGKLGKLASVMQSDQFCKSKDWLDQNTKVKKERTHSRKAPSRSPAPTPRTKSPHDKKVLNDKRGRNQHTDPSCNRGLVSGHQQNRGAHRHDRLATNDHAHHDGGRATSQGDAKNQKAKRSPTGGSGLKYGQAVASHHIERNLQPSTKSNHVTHAVNAHDEKAVPRPDENLLTTLNLEQSLSGDTRLGETLSIQQRLVGDEPRRRSSAGKVEWKAGDAKRRSSLLASWQNSAEELSPPHSISFGSEETRSPDGEQIDFDDSLSNADPPEETF